jgi:hypothetical protein
VYSLGTAAGQTRTQLREQPIAVVAVHRSFYRRPANLLRWPTPVACKVTFVVQTRPGLGTASGESDRVEFGSAVAESLGDFRYRMIAMIRSTDVRKERAAITKLVCPLTSAWISSYNSVARRSLDSFFLAIFK